MKGVRVLVVLLQLLLGFLNRQPQLDHLAAETREIVEMVREHHRVRDERNAMDPPPIRQHGDTL